VIPLHLPPLRERGDDIVMLAHYFVHKLARKMSRPVKRLSVEAVEALRAYSWPGNVRELEHAIEHAFVLSRGDELGPRDLPIATAQSRPPAPIAPAHVAGAPIAASDALDLPYMEAKRRAVAAFDQAYIDALMQRCAGNASEAARQAGLDRSNFRRLLRKAKP
jgi:DNA-binding NtrC family response regulator